MTLTLYLLNALAINYPILYSMGLVLPYPISLVFPSGIDIRSVVNKLSFWPVIIDSTMKVSKAKEHIFRANSEAVVLLMPPRIPKKDPIKFIAKLSMLQDISSLHRIDGKEVVLQTFLAFENLSYPVSGQSDPFEIMLSDSVETIRDPVPVYPQEDDLSVVFYRIEELKKRITGAENQVKLVLNSALEFTYPRWNAADRLAEFEQLTYHIDNLCNQNIERQDLDITAEMAAELLSDYVFNQLTNIIPLTGKQRNFSSEALETSIFRYGKLLYLSSGLFKCIVNPLLIHADILQIKRGLAQAGMLRGDSRTKYRRTMVYQEGDTRRENSMICLDGSRLPVKGCPGSSLLDFMW